MKRAILVGADFHRWGGMDRPNYELAWYLADVQQMEVHIVSHFVAEPLASHPAVVWHRVVRPFGRHALGDFGLRAAAQRVARKLASAGTRVVSNGGCFVWPDVNWVHYVHAAWNDRHRPKRWHHRLRGDWLTKKDRRDERQALTCAQLVIANSEATRSHIIQRLDVPAGRVHVVYYGIDADEFRPISQGQLEQTRSTLGWNGSPTALFIGGLGHDRRKGIDTVIDAWCELCQSTSWDVRLLVVGAGADVHYWRKYCEAKNLSHAVEFLGFTKQVPAILSAADVLISATRYDAYGQGVHEALCCGLPAFVTETAGVAERYPDELSVLRLAAPPSSRDIAARLREWRGRPHEYALKVRDFSDRLRRRSWSDMAHEMFTLLDTDAG